jgi:hypothetical protein
MNNDTTLPFSFPAVGSKKITDAIDGERISSDSGVIFLAQAECKLAITDKLAAAIGAAQYALSTRCRTFCARGICLLLAAMKTLTISTICVLTSPSNWPADNCRTQTSDICLTKESLLGFPWIGSRASQADAHWNFHLDHPLRTATA